MSHVVQTPRTSSDRLWTLATVGLAVLCVLLAVTGAYDPGAVVAFAGVLCGGWSMLVSRTTGERFEIVSATVVAAVALAVCLAYGSGFAI